MQTAINLNADSEWDGIAQTIKKSLVKVQVQIEASQKELKKELNEKFEDSKKENQELNMKLDEILISSTGGLFYSAERSEKKYANVRM